MVNQFLAVLADFINPALTVLTLAVTWIERDAVYRRGSQGTFWARTLLGLAVVYSIKFADILWLDKAFWPYLGLHYSTHTAYAVSLTTSLAVLNRRWLLFLVPVLGLYAVMMIYLKYHSLGDIVITALIIAPATWLIHQVGNAKRPLETDIHSSH